MRRDRRAAAPARGAGARGAVTILLMAAGCAVGGVAPAGASVAHAQYLGLQWGLSAIGAPAAWQYGTGGGVRIGIVDTGVDLAQQDLQGKVVASAVFESQPSSGCATPTSAQDDNGHGTHVAGIAAATGARGVEGVAPGASLVVAKVLDCQGGGTYQDVADGINWVVSQGARVVNLSLGDAGTGLVDQSQVTGNPLAGALQNAWAHGAVGVVAAGNNSNGLLGLGEANFANVPAVVVAATGPQGHLASYSNSVDSAQWGVAAPGGDDPNGPTTPACGTNDPSEILSTYWTAADPVGCYATDEGTSMATPFVSGTLALLLGRGLNPSQAVQVLLGSADHAVSCGADCSGLVDAHAAMAAAAGRTTPSGAGAAPAGAAPAGPGTTTAAPAARGSSAPAPPPTSAATTTPPPAAAATPAVKHRAARAPVAGHHHPDWWLVLPFVLGLAIVSLIVVTGRRLLVLRRPVTTPPAPGPAEEPDVVHSGHGAWPG